MLTRFPFSNREAPAGCPRTPPFLHLGQGFEVLLVAIWLLVSEEGAAALGFPPLLAHKITV
jgi:hypothetical protein